MKRIKRINLRRFRGLVRNQREVSKKLVRARVCQVWVPQI